MRVRARVRRATAILLALGLGACHANDEAKAPPREGARVASPFYRNDLGRVYDHALPACQEAARRACEELGYVVKGSSGDRVEAELTARKKDAKTIHIRFLRLADGVTRVRVRVGWLGDEAIANAIHEAIARRL